jgi:transcriptional regulator with XRE-family HTH domain
MPDVTDDDEHRPYIEQGRGLARLRNEARLRQHQLAAAFGIQPAAVSSWETGRTRPEPERLHELDRLLGATGEVFALYGQPAVADGALSADVAAIRAVLESMMGDIVPANLTRMSGIQSEMVRLAEAQIGLLESHARLVESVQQLTAGLLATKPRPGRAAPARPRSTR